MKSKIERVAALAIELGQPYLAEYGAVRSRHDFTQRQLMACLILRAYLRTTYRGLIDVLAGHTGLRQVLGMEMKLPHYTTLQKFSSRSQVLEIADMMLAKIGRAALRIAREKEAIPAVVIDATGMETTTASAHFLSRSGRARRRWVKVSLSVVCGGLFPLGMVLDWAPSSDIRQADVLLQKSEAAAGLEKPRRLYGDAGYDADRIHAWCREHWGVESIIKPRKTRADGHRGGLYRSTMTPEHLKRSGYGKRWQVESFMSGLKRMTGSGLSAQTPAQQLKEAAIRVVAYALHR